MPIYTIYKTVNLINGKYYIGAHSTHNINDDYLGSGRAIQAAIKKYGKHNFKKSIIYICSSEEEMFLKEKEIINEQIINDINSYNMTFGGKGGWSHIDVSGSKNPMKNPKIKEKVRESWKANPNNRLKTLNNLKKATEKARETNLGKKRSEHSEWMKQNRSKIYNREKVKESMNKNHYVLISPNGVEYITNRLTEFIKKYNLSVSLYESVKQDGKILKRGRCKGWSCKIYQP
jgi:hypothetical protein